MIRKTCLLINFGSIRMVVSSSEVRIEHQPNMHVFGNLLCSCTSREYALA